MTDVSTCPQTILLWLRYVDDTFTAVHKDEIDEFYDHLNEQNADIQFTKEVEEDGKLPFLTCLVSRDENTLRTTVYRKPTHTDRLLDESSYNPTSHKATTIKTLTRRAQLVCNTPDSLYDGNKYLRRVFDKNNYKDDFNWRNAHRPTETTETNAYSTPTTTATIPYIKGTSETIARNLQPYNIRVAHKPITTLRHLLTNVKDTDEPNSRQGACLQDQMLRLPSLLHRRDWHESQDQTDWTQTSDEKWWCQQSHCWTSSTHEPQYRLGLCTMCNLQH